LVLDPPIFPGGLDHFFDDRYFFQGENFMTEARSKARPSRHTADGLPRSTLAAALLLAVVAAFGLHALFVSGPAMREAAEAELLRVIADEDRDVCGQFGLRPGTTAFAACSRELATVRQKQSDRDKAAGAGFL
jgi:hypothetical protein